MIGNSLFGRKTPESLVAWYATVAYASKVLALRSELNNSDLRGEPIELTAQSILKRLNTQDYENGSNFRLFSGLAIPCFLLSKLRRDPSTISSARERIRKKTISYLKRLKFSIAVIETVQDTIDRIDGPFLEEFEREKMEHPNPNVFWGKWCNYFRNLDASDLSLFRP